MSSHLLTSIPPSPWCLLQALLNATLSPAWPTPAPSQSGYLVQKAELCAALSPPSKKDVHIRICGCVPYTTKDLEMGRLRWIFWTQYNYRVLIRKTGRRESKTKRCNDRSKRSERENAMWRCYSAGFEDGGRWHKLRNAQPLEARKGMKTDRPLEPLEET